MPSRAKSKNELRLKSKEAKSDLQKVRQMDELEKLKALLDAVSVVDNLPKSQRSALMLGVLAGADLYQINLAEIVDKPVARKTSMGKADPVW